MNFGNLCGNNSLKEKLSSWGENLPHALLIEGEEGLGKHTLSKVITAYFLCKGQNVHQSQKPCMQCNQCNKVLNNIHPDVTEYTGGDHNRSFKVEWIREIKSNCNIIANEGNGKVFILNKAHTMNPSAQNALLKVLEEPPANVLFILCCSSSKLMLETIRSRTTILTMQPVDKAQAKSRVSELVESSLMENFNEVYNLTGGNIGKIVTFLTDEIEKNATKIAIDIINSLASNKESDILLSTAPLCSGGKNSNSKALFLKVLQRLEIYFEEALVTSYLPQGINKEISSSAIFLKEKFTKKKLISFLEYIPQQKIKLEQFINQSLVVANMCATLRNIAQK